MIYMNMTDLSKMKISWQQVKQYTSPETQGGRHNKLIKSYLMKEIESNEFSNE